MDIRIRDLAKDFGAFPALHGVDLDVRDGELLALLGPSGSGKTTLLRAIAGLEQPTRGRIFFGDEEASAKPVRERGVGFVFQHYALFKHMTVADNIGFGLSVRPRRVRPAKAAIRERVLALLDLVRLPGLENRYPAQLSGGQRQRVALARALAVDPKVLLLDEPFGALDAKVRKELRRWLREVHDATGTTTVFVTHDQEEALELADRVVVLDKGRIEQIGSPDEVYDAPATPFVVSFIGDSTELAVTLDQGRAWLWERAVPLGMDVVGHGPARLFVRPQHWDVVAPAQGLAGTVSTVTRHGPGRRAEVEVAPGIAVTVDVAAETPIASGDRVGLKAARWRLFLADGRMLTGGDPRRAAAVGGRA